VVECDLAKVEVASSNLVSRSKIRQKGEGRKENSLSQLSPFAFLLFPLVWRRSQVVRQRSAKPLFIGSIPIAASIISSINLSAYGHF
jgi:hypothetical protein